MTPGACYNRRFVQMCGHYLVKPVGDYPRSFARGKTVYDPWHYVPELARKPGTLRNGAPFKDWVLPASLERVRRRLASVHDGNRQRVDVLAAVLVDGLPALDHHHHQPGVRRVAERVRRRQGLSSRRRG